MGKEEKEKKIETEKELEQLREEIAQKGKEIEEMKKTIEETRANIRAKEEVSENRELGKIFEDVSGLLDAGFSIFSPAVKGGKSRGKGLFGLINDLAALAEKSETYQKRVNLGKRGVAEFRVSSRPIRRSYTAKPTGQIRIRKPKKETLIKEGETIVDIFEEEDQIRVLAELPGIEENEINLSIDDNTLTISTDIPDRKYYKKVELPTLVKKETLESSYRNGILEVKLRKAKNTNKEKKD